MAPSALISPDSRKIVGVRDEVVTDTTDREFPGSYWGEDHSWSLDRFRDNLNIEFHNNEQHDASFSVVGIDASIANAFRRIMIAEIPTMAVEQVFIFNNTSIIHDEILAQRLGLIPLKGAPEFLSWLKAFKRADPIAESAGSDAYDQNTVQLKLQVECTWKDDGRQKAIKGETDPTQLYNNSTVYARQITFEPKGAQAELFPSNKIEPVNPDIIIAKMRPGQKIDLTMFANKGLGGDHAKFSPVCTATYRLMPHIDILKPIIGADASKFARCFNPGVIKKVPITKAEAAKKGSGYEGHEGEMKAVVANPMKDAVTRECLRHDEFKDKVKLGRIRNHFIFSVESTGQYDSDDIFLKSIEVLKGKAQKMKRQMLSHAGASMDVDTPPASSQNG